MNVENYPMVLTGVTEQIPQFESYPLAAAGLAVAAAGLAVVLDERNRYRSAQEELVYPDPDQAEPTTRALKREKFAKIAAYGLAFTAVSSALAHEAEPYTEHSSNTVENVSVIVDTSYGAYAKDVVRDNESTTRLEAVVNGINHLDNLDDITISFVAAGSTAESMGAIDNGKGKNQVVESFETYIGDYGNKSSSDIEGALNVAEAMDPDKVLIFGPVENASSPLLKNEDAADQNKVSIVAVGTPGSKVEYLGTERDAPFDKKTNDAIVGKEDSYSASSVEDLQKVVTDIVDEQYVETERTDSKFFEKVRNASLGGLAGVTILFATSGSLMRLRRKGKK